MYHLVDQSRGKTIRCVEILDLLEVPVGLRAPPARNIQRVQIGNVNPLDPGAGYALNNAQRAILAPGVSIFPPTAMVNHAQAMLYGAISVLFPEHSENVRSGVLAFWETVRYCGIAADIANGDGIPAYDPAGQLRQGLTDFAVRMNVAATNDPFVGYGYVAAGGAVDQNTLMSALLVEWNPARPIAPAPLVSVDFATAGVAPYANPDVRLQYYGELESNGEVTKTYNKGMQILIVAVANQGNVSERKRERYRTCPNGPDDLESKDISDLWGLVRPYFLHVDGPARTSRFFQQVRVVLNDDIAPVIRNELDYAKNYGETSINIISQTMVYYPTFPWAHFTAVHKQVAKYFATVEKGERVVKEYPHDGSIIRTEEGFVSMASAWVLPPAVQAALTAQGQLWLAEMRASHINPYRRFTRDAGQGRLMKDLVYLCKKILMVCSNDAHIKQYQGGSTSIHRIALDKMVADYADALQKTAPGATIFAIGDAIATTPILQSGQRKTTYRSELYTLHYIAPCYFSC